ncbi:MAG: hypothetical protein SOR72_04530 [Hornefia sp.]|nr:hypothetical protein [Hornefia sp.]
MIKKKVIALLLSCAMAFASGVFVFATENHNEDKMEAESTANCVESMDDVVLKKGIEKNTEKILLNAVDEDDVYRELVETKDSFVSGSDNDVEIPLKANDSVMLHQEDSLGNDSSIKMTLPEVIEGKKGVPIGSGTIVYGTNEDKVTVAVQGTEQIKDEIKEVGVRSLIMIKDSTAPKTYTFDFELPKKARLMYGYEWNANEYKNGEIVVVDEDGFLLSTIKAPWARDAKGKDIDTHYEIKDNSLVQIVKFDKQATFPIVADPWYGKSFKIKKFGKVMEKGFTGYPVGQGKYGFCFDKKGGLIGYSRGNGKSVSASISLGAGYGPYSLSVTIGFASQGGSIGAVYPVPKKKGCYKLRITEYHEVQKYKVLRRWKEDGRNGKTIWREYSRNAKVGKYLRMYGKVIKTK